MIAFHQVITDLEYRLQQNINNSNAKLHNHDVTEITQLTQFGKNLKLFLEYNLDINGIQLRNSGRILSTIDILMIVYTVCDKLTARKKNVAKKTLKQLLHQNNIKPIIVRF